MNQDWYSSYKLAQAARAVEHLDISDQNTLEEALLAMESVFVNPSAVEFAEAKFSSSAR